jgi:hypothetical protein
MMETVFNGCGEVRLHPSLIVGARPVGVENLLMRDFSANEPETKWVMDITENPDARRSSGIRASCSAC